MSDTPLGYRNVDRLDAQTPRRTGDVDTYRRVRDLQERVGEDKLAQDTLPTEDELPSLEYSNTEYSEPETTTTPEGARITLVKPQHRVDPDALKALVNVAPYLRTAPEAAIDLVRRFGDDQGRLLRRAADSQAFVEIYTLVGRMEQAPSEVQQTWFEALPRERQAAVREFGFRPPSERPQANGIISPGFNVPYLSDAVEGVWDATAGGVVSRLGDVGGAAISFLDDVTRHVQAGVRTGMGAAQGELSNRSIAELWQQAYTDDLFDSRKAREIDERFDDPAHAAIVRRLASGEDIYSIAEDYGDYGDLEYGQALDALHDFTNNELVQVSIRDLKDARINAGVGLAHVLHLNPGDYGYGTTVSLTNVALEFVDPTLALGKVAKGLRVARLGIGRTTGDGAARVLSFFDDIDEARLGLRAVTNPAEAGYWSALDSVKLTPTQRAGVVISDALRHGVNDPEVIGRVWEQVPQAQTLIPHLLKEGVESVSDYARVMSEQVGLTLLLQGRHTHAFGQYVMLPRLTKAGMVRARSKIAWTDTIDFMGSANVRVRQALETDDVVGGVDRLLTMGPGPLNLSSVTNGVRSLTQLVPEKSFLRFSDAESAVTANRLLGFKVYGAQRRRLLGTYLKADTAPAKRAVTENILRTVFHNIGITEDTQPELWERWITRQVGQAYADDAVDADVVNGVVVRSGIWGADIAHGISIPDFRTLSAVMQRDRLGQLVNGMTNNKWAQTFMDFWRPWVILRPAFALRAGGEEALSQLALFGPGHLLKHWLVAPLGGKRDDVPLWSTRMMRAMFDSVFDALPAQIDRRVGSSLHSLAALDLARRSSRAFTDVLDLPTSRLRHVARYAMTPEEVTVYRAFYSAMDERKSLIKAGVEDLELTPVEAMGMLEHDSVLDGFDLVGAEVGTHAMLKRGGVGRVKVNIGTAEEPNHVPFVQVDNEYAFYKNGDVLYPHAVVNSINHLAGDPVATRMADAAALYVSENTATRLASLIPDTVRPAVGADTPAEQVRWVRQMLGNRDPRVRGAVVGPNGWLYAKTEEEAAAALDYALHQLGSSPDRRLTDLIGAIRDGQIEPKDVALLFSNTRRTMADLAEELGAPYELLPGDTFSFETPVWYHGTVDPRERMAFGDPFEHANDWNLIGPGTYTSAASPLSFSYAGDGGVVYALGWMGDRPPKVLELEREWLPDDVRAVFQKSTLMSNTLYQVRKMRNDLESGLLPVDDALADAILSVDEDLSNLVGQPGASFEMVEQEFDAARTLLTSFDNTSIDRYFHDADQESLRVFTGEIGGGTLNDQWVQAMSLLGNPQFGTLTNRHLRDALGYDGLAHLGGQIAGGGSRLHEVRVWLDMSNMAIQQVDMATAASRYSEATLLGHFGNLAPEGDPLGVLESRMGSLPWLTTDEAGNRVVDHAYLRDRTVDQANDLDDRLAEIQGDLGTRRSAIYDELDDMRNLPSDVARADALQDEARRLSFEQSAIVDIRQALSDYGSGTKFPARIGSVEVPMLREQIALQREALQGDPISPNWVAGPELGSYVRMFYETDYVTPEILDDIESRLDDVPTRTVSTPDETIERPWYTDAQAAMAGDREAAVRLQSTVGASRMKGADRDRIMQLDRVARATPADRLMTDEDKAWFAHIDDTLTAIDAETPGPEIRLAADRMLVLAERYLGLEPEAIRLMAPDDVIEQLRDVYNAVSVDEAIDLNATRAQQRLDQIFMAPDDEPIYELLLKYGEGRVGIDDVRMIEGSRLPARALGPKLEPYTEPSKMQAFLNRGFSILGRQVAAISRKPIFLRNAANRLRQADNALGGMLRDPVLRERMVAVLGEDQLDDVVQELMDATLALPISRRHEGLSGNEVLGIVRQHIKGKADLDAGRASRVVVQEDGRLSASMASTNTTTGTIRLNRNALANNYRLGLRYERGLAGSVGSKQKGLVFEQQGVNLADLQTWFDENGGFDTYVRFITEHEKAHLALGHTGTHMDDWESPESIAKEIAANEWAFAQLDMPFGASSVPMPTPDWDTGETIAQWWRQERQVRQELMRVGLAGAVHDTVPFIDDHRIRSQFSEQARNVFPFWFAQEQFYKRWARVFTQSPQALQRLNLTHNAMYQIGWIEKDERGEDVFVYPGGDWTINALASVSDVLGIPASIPVASQLTGQVRYAAPGLDVAGGGVRDMLPQGGPLFTLPLNVLRRVDPMFAELEVKVLGDRVAGRSYIDAVLPATLVRFYKSFVTDPDTYASSVAGAMQQLMATESPLVPGVELDDEGNPVLPETPHNVEVFLDRVRNWGRVTHIARSLLATFGPASPQLEADPSDLAPEFLKLIRSGMPYERAVHRFLEANPDADAFTVFGTQSPSKAPVDPTEETYDFLLEHEQLFFDKPDAMPWFMPAASEPGGDAFYQLAWDEMLAHKVRVRRGLDDMYDEIKYRAAAGPFYAEQDRKDEALERVRGNGQARDRIEALWREWKTDYLKLHPTFAERYNNPAGPALRQRVLEQAREVMPSMLDLGVEQAPVIEALLDEFDRLTAAKEQSKAQRGGSGERGRRQRDAMIVAFDQWASAKAKEHPTALAFYERILAPEAGVEREG